MAHPALLVLIRHAESERNRVKEGRPFFRNDEERKALVGIPDHEIEVTTEGAAHARRLGDYLRRKFDAPHVLYHSGYRRAETTAKCLLEAYPEYARGDIKVKMDALIRERSAGFGFDMTEEEYRGHFPYHQQFWETFGGFIAKPPGGESLYDKMRDFRVFYNSLVVESGTYQKKIFLVTHGGTIRAARFFLEGMTYEDALAMMATPSPRNCGVTVYRYDAVEECLKLASYDVACD